MRSTNIHIYTSNDVHQQLLMHLCFVHDTVVLPLGLAQGLLHSCVVIQCLLFILLVDNQNLRAYLCVAAPCLMVD